MAGGEGARGMRVPKGAGCPGVHLTSHIPGAQASPHSSGGVSPRRAGAEGNQVRPDRVRKQPWPPPWAAAVPGKTRDLGCPGQLCQGLL